MMKHLAVIGLGNIAHRHRQNLRTLFPHAKIYAMSSRGRVVDESLTNCDGTISSVEELIGLSLDLAIVASPCPVHHEQAIPLLDAHIPTLVEKPLSDNTQTALAIKAAAIDSATPLKVGYCLRFMPSAQKLRKLLRSGLIGRLHNVFVEAGQYLPDWRPHMRYQNSVSANSALGGGVLLELSHEFDYLLWLLGDLKLEHAIIRSASELALSVEDIADVVLTTAEGAVVNLHLDFIQKSARRTCRFVGEHGALEWDLVRNEIRHYGTRQQDIPYSDTKWQANEMYLDMLRDFIQQIEQPREQHTPDTGLTSAIDTVALVESIKQKFGGNSVSGS